MISMATNDKRERRLKKRKQRQQRLLIRLGIILAVAIILTPAYIFFGYRIHKTGSFDVNQEGTMSAGNDTILYDSDFAVFGDKLEEDVSVTIKRFFKGTIKDKTSLFAEVNFNGSDYFVEAKNVFILEDNPVNSYIEKLGFPHSEITDDIQKIFAQDPYKDAPTGVVVHDTGMDDTTIEGEINNMLTEYDATGTFVHSFIDAEKIIRIANEDYMAYGAGKYANDKFVQFEMPHETTKDGFAMQTANAAYYTAFILLKYNLPVTLGQEDGSGTVWTHEMVSLYLGDTDHIDPVEYWAASAKEYFDTTYDINNFISLVQAYYLYLQQ